MFLFAFIIIASADFRGIWIPRWSIPDNQRIFEVIDNNFNHIFLQIFANGEAYYPSSIAPVRYADDRWLKDFLMQAHRRGIKVSAWINVFYSWGYSERKNDKRHPINFAIDWYVQDKNQRSICNYSIEELKSLKLEGYYLAPANLSVRIYLLKIVEEIISRYNFDGIHLDYIRYPSERFVYDVHLRSQFQRKYFYDPIKLNDNSLIMRLGIKGIDDLNLKWHEKICSDLTEFVMIIKNKIKSIRPECLISAAVKPDYTVARYEFYQDWLTWVNNGLVDFVCLMAYAKNIEPIINKTLNIVNNPSTITVGLGLYSLTPETIKNQLAIIKKTPFAGFVYFSYPQVKENRKYLELINNY